MTVVGRPDVKVADIVNPGDYFDGGGLLQWVDTTRDGAEEYVKGYVAYFRELGAVFLRIDFLAWYETGFDQSEGTVGVAHGRDSYLRALEWMREAAGDMQLSLVMPNLFDHGSGERQYGDLVRIDNDVSFGTWYNLSEGRQTWQPEWSQWNNPFLGFTGFADISGRGQMILDGDPLIMQTFANDERAPERHQPLHHGRSRRSPSPTTSTPSATTRHIFQNREVLALRKAGLVGKPVFNNSHGFEYDPSSRDPERWIGQLPDGSWAVALFNRQDGPGTVNQVDRLRRRPRLHRSGCGSRPLGPRGPGVDDQLSRWPSAPHASVLLSVRPQGPAHFQAEVGAWAGSARFENTFAGHEGMGYVTGLDTEGSSVAVAISVPQRRQSASPVPRRQRHRQPVDADRTGARPGDRRCPRHGHAPTCRARRPGPRGRPCRSTLTMAAGTNLVVCSVESPDQRRGQSRLPRPGLTSGLSAAYHLAGAWEDNRTPDRRITSG